MIPGFALGPCLRLRRETPAHLPVPRQLAWALAAALLHLLGPVASAQDAADLVLLREKRLAIPVEGVAPAQLHNSFSQGRLGHLHEAIDIAAPRGAKVFAVEDGKLVKLFASVPGGLTVYQSDPQGRFIYYYAHLDRYADGLFEGMLLRRCDVLGYVGTTGNAPVHAPHLHFAIFRMGPEKQWWRGTALDPYPVLGVPMPGVAAAGVDPPVCR